MRYSRPVLGAVDWYCGAACKSNSTAHHQLHRGSTDEQALCEAIISSAAPAARHPAGLLSLLADKKTPGTINALGLVLLAAAAGVVYAVPDDSTALLAAQAVGAAVLAGAGGAAFVGSSLLASFQK